MLVVLVKAHVVHIGEADDLIIKLRVVPGGSLDDLDTVGVDPGDGCIEIFVRLFLERVYATVFTVYVQHAEDAALVDNVHVRFLAQALAQLVADDGLLLILPGAQQQIRKFSRSAAEDVVLQGFLPV